MSIFTVIGTIDPPEQLDRFGPVEGSAIGSLLNLFLNILVVAGGIYALLNFALAGYAFMSAGDDPKKIVGAWQKIWQSALGLVVLAGSFTLAAIFGRLIFDDWTAILQPRIPLPGP